MSEHMLTSVLLFKRLQALTESSRFLVAYSGGLDSHVLLHALANLPQAHSDFEIRAVHVHHGLSTQADAWVEHCLNTCRELNIELSIQRAVLPSLNNKSIEETAREMRYQIFAEVLHDNEGLMTAHHQDDQAETLLLQLFRGAGPKGLAAMPEAVQFAKGCLLRPLLRFSRDDIKQYALHHGLCWVEDDSNTNLSFDRNYIRHQVFPIVKKRWPSVAKTVARAAQHCANADFLLEQLAESDLTTCLDPRFKTLSITALLQLDEIRQRNVIRYWLRWLHLPVPSSVKLSELTRMFLYSRQDAMPYMTWEGAEVRRYRNYLYAMPPLNQHDCSLVIPWDLTADLQLPNDLGVLSLQSLIQQGLDIKSLHDVTVQFRKGGEKCRIQSHNMTQSLKKLFQVWGVPPWQRSRIPLIYQGDNLCAIIGYSICSQP
jgi:tRNA(Ile)-lysidine synthase